MTKNRLLVVHPKDCSTEFLQDIYIFLSEKFNEKIVVFNIDYNNEDHEKVKKIIEESNGEKILFLGHGTSFSLQGAKSEAFNIESFIAKKELNIFKGLELLCLSCKSSEMLYKNLDFNNIGFGDLPTQFEEIQGARELESTAYFGVENSTIEKYREILVSIMSNSVYEWLEFEYSIRMLKNRIKIRINKAITDIKLSTNDLGLISLLKEMKNDIIFNEVDS